ncbi:GNAT family N-acetyltransferase [Marinicella sp. W31]|uniref:GNAT family N-acetyltransferase n=1 Tax=Marinicella sp. W31 TaxID=3023713 RepID=UPI003756B486
MNITLSIRALRRQDLPAIKTIIDENQLFPSEFMDSMAQSYLDDTSQEVWFVAHTDHLVGVAYCAPERMTDETWNLLLIAVKPDHHGLGIGKQLVLHVEAYLKTVRGRLLLVETSGLPQYFKTRGFYPQCGFSQVACIPEYYAKNEDKVVFWKLLKDQHLD